MPKKYIYPVLLSLVLFSCASRKTTPELAADEAEPTAASTVTVAPPRRDAEPMKRSAEEAQAATKPAVSGLAQQLSEAVKAQKDPEIYRLAGQILLESPNDLKALNALALYYYKKGRFSASQYLLRKAAVQSPNSGEIHSNLGLIHLALDERREAVLEFRKAMELNPDDAVAAANIGSIYIEEKDYEKALVALDTVTRRGWKDPKILVNYAIALTASGKYDKAEDIYKGLSKEQSSNREMLMNYAILQIEHLKKYSEGLETINRLKFIGPPADSRKRLAALEAKAKAKKASQ